MNCECSEVYNQQKCKANFAPDQYPIPPAENAIIKSNLQVNFSLKAKNANMLNHTVKTGPTLLLYLDI